MLADIFPFILHHWILFLALLITVLLLVWEESKNKVGGLRLSLSDVTHLINHDHAVLIDLRDTAAFNQGHMINALHFPHTEIMQRLDKLKKYQNKPLILIHSTDKHAVLVAHQLQKQGFQKTYCLAGGLPTWLNAGLPLTKAVAISHK